MPPEPTVKILKRPSEKLQNTNDSRVYQPKKTLQQRKQEYAEARLRILGETEKTEEKYVHFITNQLISDSSAFFIDNYIIKSTSI